MSGASPIRVTAAWRRCMAFATSIGRMSASSSSTMTRAAGLLPGWMQNPRTLSRLFIIPCAAANFSLAHEIGHLLGARHELAYVNGTKWRDIMGLKDSCGGCPRLPVWSNPTVLVKGEPAGTAEHNNASMIARHAAKVAAFK